jgi:splicing factor 3B subunit 2
MASVASGLETPDFIELRKDTRKAVAPESDEPKHLYQVLPEVQKNIQGFMGSQHGYNLSNINANTAPAVDATVRSSKRKMGESVDVALDPSELESGIEESKLRANFEAAKASQLPQGTKEDFSDMVAERASKDAKKRKLNENKKDSKKKEFKF